MTRETVTINGNVYDAKTGDIIQIKPRERSVAAPAGKLHKKGVQKSQTLQRKYIQKTARVGKATAPERPKIIHRSSKTRQMQDIRHTKHPEVVKFAKKAPANVKKAASSTPDIAPTKHAALQQAHKRQALARQKRVALSSQTIKKQAIEEATAKMTPRKERKEVKPAQKSSILKRLVNVGSVAFAILLMGAYFTYINMPTLSTRIAAAQAGINASYPGYQPSGYSLSGPVAYQQGSVVMDFQANGGNEKFTLTQTRSEWDSLAVLDNYVKPQSNDSYTTTRTNGLTIYTYDNNAAWVNGGILYTVSGDVGLTTDQLQRLATSL